MEQYAKQTEEMLKKAQEMAMPEGFQKAMEDNLVKTRDAYSKFSEIAHDAGKAFEKVVDTAHKGTKTITTKVIEQATENTEAAFNVAEAIVQTKSVPEATQIQADYMKRQLETMSNQVKEIYELSNKVASETAKSLNTATTKAFSQVK